MYGTVETDANGPGDLAISFYLTDVCAPCSVNECCRTLFGHVNSFRPCVGRVSRYVESCLLNGMSISISNVLLTTRKVLEGVNRGVSKHFSKVADGSRFVGILGGVRSYIDDTTCSRYSMPDFVQRHSCLIGFSRQLTLVSNFGGCFTAELCRDAGSIAKTVSVGERDILRNLSVSFGGPVGFCHLFVVLIFLTFVDIIVKRTQTSYFMSRARRSGGGDTYCSRLTNVKSLLGAGCPV